MNATSVRPFSPLPQADLFTAPNGLPKVFGTVRTPSRAMKRMGLRASLPISFKPFDFHGYLANRHEVSFGYRYDYDRYGVVEASPFRSFLVSL